MFRSDRITPACVVPALSALEDARKRAYVAGIHVFAVLNEDMGTNSCLPEFRSIESRNVG